MLFEAIQPKKCCSFWFHQCNVCFTLRARLTWLSLQLLREDNWVNPEAVELNERLILHASRFFVHYCLYIPLLFFLPRFLSLFPYHTSYLFWSSLQVFIFDQGYQYLLTKAIDIFDQGYHHRHQTQGISKCLMLLTPLLRSQHLEAMSPIHSDEHHLNAPFHEPQPSYTPSTYLMVTVPGEYGHCWKCGHSLKEPKPCRCTFCWTTNFN